MCIRDRQGGNVAALLKLHVFPNRKFLYNKPKKWSNYSEREGTLCKLIMIDGKVELPTGVDRRTYWHSVMAPYTSYSMSNLRGGVQGGVREQWKGRN